MNDDIEKARAAHAALIAAKAACDAAGLKITFDVLSRESGTTDAVAAYVERAARHIASMERRAVPIAFGDTVTMSEATPIKREAGPLALWDQERCAVCRARTPLWTDIPDRTDGAQVALCVACASMTPPSMVPTKNEWFAKERSLERPTWRQ